MIGPVAPIVPSQRTARLCAAILDRRDTVPAPPFSTAVNSPDLRLLKKAETQKQIGLCDWRRIFDAEAAHLPPAIDPTRITDVILSSPGISLRGLHRYLGNNVKKELLVDALERAINDGRIRKEKRLTGGRPAATFWPVGSPPPQPPERTKPVPDPTVAVATGVEPAVSSPDTYPDAAVEAL